MKVLGVDDDRTLLLLQQEFFEERGHTFFACETQTEALPILQEHELQLAVLDYHLGKETCSLLAGKLLVDFPECEIVLTTGDHEKETLEAIRAMGVERVVFKPFRFRDLAAAIEDLEEKDQKEHPEENVRLTRYTTVDQSEIDALRAVLRANPQDRNARWLLSFSYYRARNYKDALTLLATIVEESPDNLLARYYLGACHYHFKDHEQALEHWNQVAELDAVGPLAAKLKDRIVTLNAILKEKRQR